MPVCLVTQLPGQILAGSVDCHAMKLAFFSGCKVCVRLTSQVRWYVLVFSIVEFFNIYIFFLSSLLYITMF